MPFPDTIEFRDFKWLNIDLFKPELNEVDWSPVYRSSDVNESLSRFLHIFNRVSNNHAPIKSVNIGCSRKILEKCNQLIYYVITEENIITPNEYGFMPGSTTV